MTTTTINPATGVHTGAAGRLPGTTHAEGPAEQPVAHDPVPGRGPAAVRHEEFCAHDPEAMRRFFARAYTPGWRISGAERVATITHRRCETGSMMLDQVRVQGRMGCEIPSGDAVVVIQPRAGSLTIAGDQSSNTAYPVLVADGGSCALQLNNAQFDVVSIAPEALHKAAANRHVPLPQQIQFPDRHPGSRAAARAWNRALDYVTATLASPDTAEQPLIAAAAVSLLATVLFECFPSNLTLERDLLSDPAVPESLKDAVAFIHGHAAGDVGVNEIAAAVHLTPRAVQYLFRNQLDNTPSEYLRRVRLHRAHRDLMAAHRSAITVTEIAQRWGFSHTGRFAVLYRQTYGQSPHTTLRQ